MKERCTAIILAAGSGKRMQSGIPKQFMPLAGRPLIYYALRAAESSRVIDDCILVTGAADIPYVQTGIVEKYGFSKVKKLVAGGGERYESVANALRLLTKEATQPEGYVFIHDGARPFLTEEILENTFQAARRYRACVAAVPSKDTVKLADDEGFAASTPQVFETALVAGAYERLMRELPQLTERGITVTDDAMVVELFSDVKVRLAEGSYRNMKVTTPEDICIAEALLRAQGGDGKSGGGAQKWRSV